MHSLTHSSASTSNPIPYISSLSSHIATNTALLSQITPIPYCNEPLTCHHTHLWSALTTSTTNSSFFFNISKDSALLSACAKDDINFAIQHGWANSTMKWHFGAIQQFIDFCITEHIPNNLHFPADEFILCAFAASSVGRHSGSTPCARLSAIKAWHIAHNMEWKGSTWLRYVLNGVHNLQSCPQAFKAASETPDQCQDVVSASRKARP